MATTRQSISSMIKNYRKNGMEFFWSNYKLSKKLGKSEKTIANTVSLMKREGELETLNNGKIRYLKLTSPKIRNIIPDAVKKFYADSGINSGTEKGRKSGSYIYNINIQNPKGSTNQQIQTGQGIDMILVNDIKKVITNFRGIILEEFVCTVGNNELLRKTLNEYINNINPCISNPAGLFIKNVACNLKRLEEDKAAAKLEQECKEHEKELNALKETELRKKEETACRNERKLNNWFNSYSANINKEDQSNELKNFILEHENFDYLDDGDKYKMINEYKFPQNLGYGDRISFKEYLEKNKQ